MEKNHSILSDNEVIGLLNSNENNYDMCHIFSSPVFKRNEKRYKSQPAIKTIFGDECESYIQLKECLTRFETYDNNNHKNYRLNKEEIDFQVNKEFMEFKSKSENIDKIITTDIQNQTLSFEERRKSKINNKINKNRKKFIIRRGSKLDDLLIAAGEYLF